MISLFMILATAGISTGQEGPFTLDPAIQGQPGEKSNEPWSIKGDQLTFFHATDVVLGEGGVTVRRGDLTVTAERMIYHQRTGKIRASGDVVINMGQDILRGQEGELDLDTSTGTVEQAYLFLHRNNVHVLANEIRKTGTEEYEADNATISTCPLPKQAWSFHCKDLKLTLGGNAVAWHNTFNIRDIPLLYSPWLAVPINRYRKTGLLLPHYAASSRNGTEITVPFFWAISDSVDLTFYQQPMSRRGWMEGVELNYAVSEETRGTFLYNFLTDTLEDNDYNGDGFVRGGEKRWWLRGKADQTLPGGFEAKLDLDLASDLDYLQEFDEGPAGFDATNDLLTRRFRRSLSVESDYVRPSTLQVTRLFSDMFTGGEGRYNDNLVPGEQDGTVQTLPRLVLHGFRERMGNTPLFFDWEGTYTNYWREEGVRYQRVHAEPRLSLPVNLLDRADLLVSATLQGTVYSSHGDDEILDPDSTPARILPLFSSDLSTTFGRTFSLASGETLMHSIRPRITYQYRPSEDQDDIPYIDIHDRLEPMNRVTWSLLSFLSSKKPLGNGRYAYSDLVRFAVEQSYDAEKSNRPSNEYYGYHTYFDFYEELEEKLRYKLAGREWPGADNFELREFSPVFAEIELRPTPWLYLRYDTTYSVYGLGFTTYNLLASLSSQAGDRLSADYRYNRLTDINEVNLDARLRLTHRWSGTYQTRWSLEQSTVFRSSYGLRYQSNCWALSGAYTKDQDENRFGLYLELLGIGGWGVEQ